MNAAKCPVCWRTIFADGSNVWRHRDTAGNNCPMSGHPFYLIEQHERAVA